MRDISCLSFLSLIVTLTMAFNVIMLLYTVVVFVVVVVTLGFSFFPLERTFLAVRRTKAALPSKRHKYFFGKVAQCDKFCARVNTVLALCIVGFKVRWNPSGTRRSLKNSCKRDSLHIQLLLSSF